MKTLTHVLLLVVSCLCSRSKIGTYADVCPRNISIDSLEYGKKAARNTFLKLYEMSLVDCAKECHLRSRCRSFNHHRRLTLCELNSDDAEVREPAKGFIVSRISRNIDWLGPCSHHDCPVDTRCKVLTTQKAECAPLEECVSPPNVENATPETKTAKVGSYIQYTCSPGYIATGGDPKVMCQPGQYWTNPAFICRLTQVYIGCYRDTQDRAMPTNALGIQSVTVETCASYCRENTNSAYFGLQFSSQCFCGDDYAKYGKVDDNECNMPCTGDFSQICGQSWRNSVYRLA